MEKSYVGMGVCYFCGKPKEIILDRRIRNVLPKTACYNQEPCDECKKLMKLGVIVISVRDGEKGPDPYRTGRWFVVKDEAFKINPGVWINFGAPGSIQLAVKDDSCYFGQAKLTYAKAIQRHTEHGTVYEKDSSESDVQ